MWKNTAILTKQTVIDRWAVEHLFQWLQFEHSLSYTNLYWLYLSFVPTSSLHRWVTVLLILRLLERTHQDLFILTETPFTASWQSDELTFIPIFQTQLSIAMLEFCDFGNYVFKISWFCIFLRRQNSRPQRSGKVNVPSASDDLLEQLLSPSRRQQLFEPLPDWMMEQ